MASAKNSITTDLHSMDETCLDMQERRRSRRGSRDGSMAMGTSTGATLTNNAVSSHPIGAVAVDPHAKKQDTKMSQFCKMAHDDGTSCEDDGEGKALYHQQRSPPASATATSSTRRGYAALSSSVSLLLGRDTVARAAKALRHGGRRSFFGDDDEDEETKHADDDTDEQTREQQALVDAQITAMQIRKKLVHSSQPQYDNESASMTSRHQHVPRLAPVRLIPKRVSNIAEMWIFLDRIERISIRDVIVRDEDTVYFVLDVFHYREQHRIPTNRAGVSASILARQGESAALQAETDEAGSWRTRHREPDFQIEQRYSSFARLRDRLWEAAKSKHPRSEGHRGCAYCDRITKYLAISPVQPSWKMKLMINTEDRKALLSRFIMDMVMLAREMRHECSILALFPSWYNAPRALMQQTVPGIVKRFLTFQTGETYMR